MSVTTIVDIMLTTQVHLRVRRFLCIPGVWRRCIPRRPLAAVPDICRQLVCRFLHITIRTKELWLHPSSCIRSSCSCEAKQLQVRSPKWLCTAQSRANFTGSGPLAMAERCRDHEAARAVTVAHLGRHGGGLARRGPLAAAADHEACLLQGILQEQVPHGVREAGDGDDAGRSLRGSKQYTSG